MKSLSFQQANASHFDAIYKFCQLLIIEKARMSFTDVTSEAILWSWMEDSQVQLYIALDGDVVVGMLKTKRGIGDQFHAVQIACAVDANYRNLNVATQVTLFGLEQERQKGARIARTLIYDWNLASIKTIERCGFICSGRIPMVHYDPITGRAEDDLIYYKMLVKEDQ
mgnify:CR=1 FL=1